MIARLDLSKVASRIAAEHPDWLLVSANGKPQIYNALHSTCLSADYSLWRRYADATILAATGKYTDHVAPRDRAESKMDDPIELRSNECDGLTGFRVVASLVLFPRVAVDTRVPLGVRVVRPLRASNDQRSPMSFAGERRASQGSDRGQG